MSGVERDEINGETLAKWAGTPSPLDEMPGSKKLNVSLSELNGEINGMEADENSFLMRARGSGKKVVVFAGSCGVALMIGLSATIAGVKVIKEIGEYRRKNSDNED
jgi:hypothetical protein